MYQILVVCLANQCRSPMAEILLRQRLKRVFGPRAGDHWTISSAGTNVADDSMMHPLGLTALEEMGVRDRVIRSRQLTPEMVSAADLILTADRAQRSFVVQMCPDAVRRTYTLRQFGRLCAAGREAGPDLVVTGLDDLMELVDRGRPMLQPVPPELDEIPDPIGGGIEEFRSTANMLRDLAIEIFG